MNPGQTEKGGRPRPKPIAPSTGITLLLARSGETPITQQDRVANEEPMEIRVAGRSLAVLMRTPGADRELTAGFLCSEGLVRTAEQILDITRCAPDSGEVEPNVIHVTLDPDHPLDWERLERHTFASSSCGLCGKTTIESIRNSFPSIESDLTVAPGEILELPARLREAQHVFHQTGGLHAAGLFSPGDNGCTLFEDVGRHNAVDKLIGHHFLERRLPLRTSILLLSGRVSFEVIQKALAAGIPLVAAISAPTSLAIQFARESGQTLIGFLRPGRMNIYTHPERVG